MVRGFRVLSLVGTVGLALAISGGASLGNATTLGAVNSATTQKHVGTILIAALYVGAAALTFLCWQDWKIILRYRRQVSILCCFTITSPSIY